jgi:hypothetical protein
LLSHSDAPACRGTASRFLCEESIIDLSLSWLRFWRGLQLQGTRDLNASSLGICDLFDNIE